ncbi:MAG: ABC transporter ATP-binding protein [bacterium]|nr:ABC transporter ATP-binding protein [bacterium]
MTRLLTMTKLVIEGFQKDGWTTIVNGVDVHIDRGEVLGLIGESGAGKSTIGIASMGYCRAGCRIVGGSIVFDGMELTTASRRALRRIRGRRASYVAQSAAASFNPAHRLIRQYAEAPVRHGVLARIEAERNARAIYRRFNLPDPDRIGGRFPHQVSGGQLQRAMVAMAMACSPDLIVFDEPTTALDVTTQIEVLAAIKDAIKDLNSAAMYITHDLAVVSQVVDRIMVLRHGDLVEEGRTKSLLASPRRSYTRALLSVRKGGGERVAHPEQGQRLLEVRDVSAAYVDGVPVLRQVNLEVTRSKTVALVGESGSGKSTLARVITGLLPPEAGHILFDGQDLRPRFFERSKEMLRRLQMIYQMPDVALNPRQKVQEILGRPLAFYFSMRGSEKQNRVSELLEQIELPDHYASRYPSELSGGEKQRIAIARALAARPDLIICDEVTSALDQLVAAEILKLLQRLQNELGVSYLFITHDLATVKVISDEIVVMLEGRVVEHGATNEVLEPPHHEYTEMLLASVPEMDPDWLDTLLATRVGALLREGERMHAPE